METQPIQSECTQDDAPERTSVGEPTTPHGGWPKNEHGCTDREEAFAYWLVQENSRSLAYRRAYKPSVNTKPGTIWTNASTVAQRPHVAKRVAMLREAAASEVVANKAVLIKFLWDRILADRRELVQYKAYNCRYCHGEHGQYQWKDTAEYAAALAAWTANVGPELAKAEPMPSDEGGYGFNPHAAPNLGCEHASCMGDGVGRTVIADTASLSGSAALIYEGMKETAQGIEVKIADRNTDMLLLSKLLGWSLEKVQGAADAAGGKGGGALPAEAYDIPSTSTPEEASRKYLSLVAG